MIELLTQLGFADCGGGVFQRKTEHTNLMVVVSGDLVSICHGSSSVNHVYAYAPIGKPIAVERIIALATLTQIDNQPYIFV